MRALIVRQPFPATHQRDHVAGISMHWSEVAQAAPIEVLRPQRTILGLFQVREQTRGLSREQPTPTRFRRHGGHVAAGDHGARHAPHQLTHREGRVRVRPRIDQVGDRGSGVEAHDHERRRNVAKQQRPMRRVFPFGELGLAGLQEPLENGAEIESCIGRADSAKVVDTPNHAGGTKIEAGVAVANSFVERVGGPESLGIKTFKPIRNDVLDCGGGVALTPGDRP
jgi:hypothetical protein